MTLEVPAQERHEQRLPCDYRGNTGKWQRTNDKRRRRNLDGRAAAQVRCKGAGARSMQVRRHKLIARAPAIDDSKSPGGKRTRKNNND
jgi:hypothetical protein